jgi:hypothetical protein
VDGTYIANIADGRVYRVVGHAPIYVHANDAAQLPGWGKDPITILSYWEFSHFQHLAKTPANGTYLRAPSGLMYRVAGGFPVPISSCLNLVGCPGAITVSASSIAAFDHMASTPMNGTVLLGVPSNAAWLINGGQRTQLSVVPSHTVAVPDDAIALFPVSAPTTTATTTTPTTHTTKTEGTMPSSTRNARRCRVPNLAGMTLAHAKATLRTRHCSVGRVTRTSSSRRLNGRVVKQRPRNGVVRPKGSRVQLWVGSGARTAHPSVPRP